MLTEIKTIPAKHYLAARRNLTLPEVQDFTNSTLQGLYAEAERFQVPITGPCEFIYFGCTGHPELPFDLLISLPIEKQEFETDAFDYFTLPETICICTDFIGKAESLREGWTWLVEEMERQSITPHPENQAREIYKQWISFDSDMNITELQVKIG
ncbi:MAG: hypothetical protein D6B25_10880 [Desulfobulbaceae bacterium]|nr:MAG: hypothetical protein D6B25_10880 [Desulfobulbaceae bacterium]